MLAAATAAALAPCAALATDGYYSHGYGMKAKGMAGASTAVAESAFGGANNPATMAFAGNRWEIGVDWFSPHREASRTGSGPAGIDGTSESGATSFFIPEFAYNQMISPELALGVTVYGNGGMNTTYPGGEIPSASACAGFNPAAGPYNLLCGNGELGVDLSQLVIAPTVAWKFTPEHSIGFSPLLGYQRFKADGLQAFAGFSTDPANFTNNGYDSATGFGARIGYFGSPAKEYSVGAAYSTKIGMSEFEKYNGYDSATGWGARVGYFGNLTKELSVGAAYSTKIAMSEFDKYKGLFAEQGGFDMPANWSVGVAFRPENAWLVAVDYRRIMYSGVKSVGNPSAGLVNCAGGDLSACLGGSNGAGFGWQDVGVWKIGVQYAMDASLTLRAGYGRSDNPIRSEDVTINILAPGVVQNHYTLGATYALDKESEITGAFMYAQKNSVSGQSLFARFGAPATTTEEISLSEYSLGVAYARKF
jgi:long-chain fatty acid transport protein